MTVSVRHGDLHQRLARRLRDDDARRVVATALTEVTLTVVYPAHHRGSAEVGLVELLEASNERAAATALEALIDGLQTVVESLPASKVDQLVTEQLVADLGLD